MKNKSDLAAAFMAESRNHMLQANRYGRIAFRTFLASVASFAIFAWRIEQGWSWWFWWGSVALGVWMLGALQQRWFHRGAARISYAFHVGDYDYQEPIARR